MRRKSEVGSALESSTSSRGVVTLSESPSAAGRCRGGLMMSSNNDNNNDGTVAGGASCYGSSSSRSESAGEMCMRRLSISSSSSSSSSSMEGGNFSPPKTSVNNGGVSEEGGGGGGAAAIAATATSFKRVPRRSCLKKKEEGVEEGGGAAAIAVAASKKKIIGLRRIAFLEEVEVVHIPNHADFSSRVKAQYWSSPEEIYEMACRNLVEYQAEGYDYESAVEEDQMFYVPETGELIHPAHVDLTYSAQSQPPSPSAP